MSLFKQRSVFIGYFEALCKKTPTTNERNQRNAVIEICDFLHCVVNYKINRCFGFEKLMKL